MNTISEKEIISIINDLLLIDYWGDRTGEVIIVYQKQIENWGKYFNDKKYDIAQTLTEKQNLSYPDQFIDLNNLHIRNVLEIGEDNISICLNYSMYRYVKIYDIYFHCDSISISEQILNKCFYYFNNCDDRMQYIIRKDVLEVQFLHCAFIFHKIVYKNKESFLSNQSVPQIGYNLPSGFYGTIVGGIAFAMKAFVLDIKKFSIEKLIDSEIIKNFSIFLPQLKTDFTKYFTVSLKNDSDDINFIRIKFYNSNSSKSLRIKYSPSKRALGFSCIDNIHNIKVNDKEFELSLYIRNDVVNLVDSSNYEIEEIIRTDMGNFESLSRLKLKNYLKESYKNFALAYFIEEDDEKASLIWENKIVEYINLAKQKFKNEIFEPNDSYHNGWTYFENYKEYYNFENEVNLRPLKIGITNNRLQALMDCRKNIDYINNIPNEVFKLICEEWLRCEFKDAKTRLLSY